MDSLPPEIFHIVDDYIDIETHQSLCLANKSVYSMVAGRWLSHLHIEASIYKPLTLSYSGKNNCRLCVTEHGANCDSWRFHTCGKRYLYLSPHKTRVSNEVLDEASIGKYQTVLRNVRSLAIALDYEKWVFDVLSAVLPRLSHLEYLEIQMFEPYSRQHWRPEISEMFKQIPGIENTHISVNADVNLVTPWPLEDFAALFPNVISYNRLLDDTSPQTLTDSVDAYKTIRKLSLVYVGAQDTKFRTTKLRQFLFSMPQLKALSLQNMLVYKDSLSEWVPPTVLSLLLNGFNEEYCDEILAEAERAAGSGQFDDFLTYIAGTNGASVKQLEVSSPSVYIDSFNFQNAEDISMPSEMDNLLQKLETNTIRTIVLDVFEFMPFPESILQTISKTVESLTLDLYGYHPGGMRTHFFHRINNFLTDIGPEPLSCPHLKSVRISVHGLSPMDVHTAQDVDEERYNHATRTKYATDSMINLVDIFQDREHFPMLQNTIFDAPVDFFDHRYIRERLYNRQRHGPWDLQFLDENNTIDPVSKRFCFHDKPVARVVR